MSETLITGQSEFDKLCHQIDRAGIVAFDTEFVSEFTYQPDLCLMQFALPERSVLVDAMAVPDLSAWWDLMVDAKTQVIVHGGREEVRFCLFGAKARPQLLWDVQVAEGLRSRSFPLGYEALVRRVIGKKVHGGETRTDWRRRPLLPAQIAYALDDVAHLLEIYSIQRNSLQSMGRIDWVDAEITRMIDEVSAERGPDSWVRLSGLHRLSPRELAVAKAVYQWREASASSRNKPIRRILRDDLILEIARRQPANEQDLYATRDMNRSDYRRVAEELLSCIAQAKLIPKSELPSIPKPEDDRTEDEHVLGQFLSLALANRCAEQNVATGLVGKLADLKHLVRWHTYQNHVGTLPRLLTGWRAKVCGDLLTELLDGQILLRVADAQSDHPLVFERVSQKDAGR